MNRCAGLIGSGIVIAFMCVAGPADSFARIYRVSTFAQGEKSASDAAAPQEPEIAKEFYPSGKIKSETPFINGKINGNKKMYYEVGVLQKEEEYRDGKKEGTSKEYYEDGKLKNFETFREDRLNGECYMNYPGGQKIMAGQCADGRKTGKWTLYHNNGTKYMEGSYQDGLMEGPWRSFSPDGWLDSEGEYLKGAQSGLWTYYDKSRRVTRKLTLKDGVVDGMCWIYRDGRLSGEGTMTGQSHHPVRHGAWKAYYKNGHLKYEGSYVNGAKNGLFKEYYPTSNIKASGEYVNNKRNGTWVFYDKDGKTVLEDQSGLYNMGKFIKKN